ncbi:hypothetical protein PSY31_22990, partial [Shigella flexneri]|nr:hypothetical protein [Shigella flexneri]
TKAPSLIFKVLVPYVTDDAALFFPPVARVVSLPLTDAAVADVAVLLPLAFSRAFGGMYLPDMGD